jgi:hypothetical protein
MKYAGNKLLILQGETGSVLNVALLVLMLLSVMVFSLGRSVSTELKIAANYKLKAKALYAAEAARAYVIAHPELFGPANIRPAMPMACTCQRSP